MYDRALSFRGLSMLALSCLGMVLGSCGTTAVTPADVLPTGVPVLPTEVPTAKPHSSVPSFSRDLLPMFAGCDECHGREVGRFDPNTYAGVLGTVVPGDPEGSAMVQMMREGHHTPIKLSEEELEVVIDWIQAGAPNN